MKTLAQCKLYYNLAQPFLETSPRVAHFIMTVAFGELQINSSPQAKQVLTVWLQEIKHVDRLSKTSLGVDEDAQIDEESDLEYVGRLLTSEISKIFKQINQRFKKGDMSFEVYQGFFNIMKLIDILELKIPLSENQIKQRLHSKKKLLQLKKHEQQKAKEEEVIKTKASVLVIPKKQLPVRPKNLQKQLQWAKRKTQAQRSLKQAISELDFDNVRQCLQLIQTVKSLIDFN